MLEVRERESLAPYAARAAESKGRADPEPEHEYRTAFQRDRDRILHTKAFRRLRGKTQVFLAPKGDHYRTRLTHTLEVAQISRTVARALFLNEDLTEAIALAHDLGHTPFGHAGEHVLNRLMPGGFRHYEQSLRVVDVLESTSRRRGLNLTAEVRDGILHHSSGKSILTGGAGRSAFTLEGRVMSLCDAIAYVHHDIDDAIRAGVISAGDLPGQAVSVLGETPSERIDAMVNGLIQGSHGDVIDIEPTIKRAMNELRGYLYANVYPSDPIHGEIRKAEKMLEELYNVLLGNPAGFVPDDPVEPSLERRVADFVAGMTDAFALQLYERMFLPESGMR